MPQCPTGFRTLPAAQVDVLVARAERIRTTLKRSLLEVGNELNEAKAGLKHGHFTNWVETEIGLSVKSAQFVMNVAKLLAKNETLSLLPRTALYALAGPKVPTVAIMAVARRIEQGDRPTAIEVKQIIAQEQPPRRNVVNVALAAAERQPTKAGVIDLRTERIIRNVVNVAETDPGLAERTAAFRAEINVAEIAAAVSEAVDTSTLHRIITLCRSVPVATLGNLADALQAL